MRAWEQKSGNCCRSDADARLRHFSCNHSNVDLDWVFQVLAAAKELHRQANMSAGLPPAAVGLPDEAGTRAFASQVCCVCWCWLSDSASS